ncbi:hypothetical protein F5X99DRAFT_370324 [Biscogniauxia marginata]|nr:hypothetical protein F5X99DRAFT_370324 [Biscogniauxia marginata]
MWLQLYLFASLFLYLHVFPREGLVDKCGKTDRLQPTHSRKLHHTKFTLHPYSPVLYKMFYINVFSHPWLTKINVVLVGVCISQRDYNKRPRFSQ